jgi:hypothetical protein
LIYKIKKVKKEKSESQKKRWKKREWKVIEEKGEKKNDNNKQVKRHQWYIGNILHDSKRSSRNWVWQFESLSVNYSTFWFIEVYFFGFVHVIQLIIKRVPFCVWKKNPILHTTFIFYSPIKVVIYIYLLVLFIIFGACKVYGNLWLLFDLHLKTSNACLQFP